MKLVHSTPGNILWHDTDTLWMARGGLLWRSSDRGERWTKAASLPLPWWQSLAVRIRLLQRLTRWEVTHLVPSGDGGWVILGFGAIWRFEESGQLRRVTEIVGRRPLALCATPGLILYGEYRGNEKRSSIHIWGSSDGGRTWRAIWRFAGTVRHVHGVFFDPIERQIWVTTGDTDEECGIWVTKDGFATLERVAGGSQQTRTVSLVFKPEGIYFGSDAPAEINHIYRMDRTTHVVERLTAVEGPVFFGSKAGATALLSTVCEPSKVNCAPDAGVWRSEDGRMWHRALSFKKDFWPKRLFQYGQVRFAPGPGDGQHVWITPVATAMDGIAHCFSVST